MTTMKKLYIIRHGESEANIDSSIYFFKNDSEIELTSNGIQQARICGKSLVNRLGQNKECCIFHSPYRRAKDTADLIDSEFVLAGIYGEIIEEPLIHERIWGELNYIVDTPRLDRKVHFNFFYKPVEGESFSDGYQRIVLFFQQLQFAKDSLPDNIIIVSHGEAIRLMIMYLKKYSIEYFTDNRTNPKNGEILEFEF